MKKYHVSLSLPHVYISTFKAIKIQEKDFGFPAQKDNDDNFHPITSLDGGLKHLELPQIII
jgi:hypothetical protein